MVAWAANFIVVKSANEQIPPVVVESIIIDNTPVEPGDNVELAPGKER